jgi:4-amino-4-deoxy-L-arabinose transferase-like glycosyltransferase
MTSATPLPAAPPARSRAGLPPVILTTAVALLLALHWWWGVSALIGSGVTNDEPVHLTSGYSYWRFNDYRMQPENGNLPQRWAALPLLVMHPAPSLNPAGEPGWWGESQQWLISNAFFFLSGNNTDYMVFCARAWMALWSVATGLLVFCWARRLWGDAGGLMALALYAVSPTALAQGPLVTSDMCAAFWLIAATGAWWRTTRRVTWGRLLLSSAVTGLAFVAKFSAVLLLPVFALLILWATFAAEPVVLALGGIPAARREIRRPGAKFGVLAAVLVAHGVATWAVIWTCFGWRYSAFAPGLPPAWKFYLPTNEILADPGLLTKVITGAFKLHFLPQAYLQGFAHVRYQADRGAFLLGRYSNTGWWWFFPYAFLAKSTVGELLAAAGLVLAATLRWLRPPSARDRLVRLSRDAWRLAPLLALAAVYWTFSLLTTLNIGQRHILPMYPALFIVAGALLRPGAQRWFRGAGAAFVLLSAGESLWVRPHYLAFFNVISGGPSQGWRQLVDSSLDWGQDLPALANWVRAHHRPGEPVYVSYFGSDNPAYQGLKAYELSPYYAYGRPRRWIELQPGLYCISATLLQDVYSLVAGPWTAARESVYQSLLKQMRAELASGVRKPDLEDFGQGPNYPLWELDRLRFARLTTYLRLRRPDAVINYTIFVYRLNAHEVHTAVDGSAKEFSHLLATAWAERYR